MAPQVDQFASEEQKDVPHIMRTITDSPTEMSEAGSMANGKDESEESEQEDSEEEQSASGSGSEDEDGDEEDEDEDEEPALKYERIGGSIPDLLKKDSASALAISNKIMVNTILSISIPSHLCPGLGIRHPWWLRAHAGFDREEDQVIQTASRICNRHMHRRDRRFHCNGLH